MNLDWIIRELLFIITFNVLSVIISFSYSLHEIFISVINNLSNRVEELSDVHDLLNTLVSFKLLNLHVYFSYNFIILLFLCSYLFLSVWSNNLSFSYKIILECENSWFHLTIDYYSVCNIMLSCSHALLNCL